MGARRDRIPPLVLALIAALAFSPAEANPVIIPFDGAFREAIVFGLICLFIVLVEGAVIKFVLFGLDGPSWPNAFLLAILLNVGSAVVGNLAGVYFDWWAFQFQPSLFAVLGISLGVEGVILAVLFFGRRLPRALLACCLMNLASYVVLALSRFPEGALDRWRGL